MFFSLSGPEPPLTPEHKPYLIGVGRADCTGPPAEIPLVRTEHITSLQLVRGMMKRSRKFHRKAEIRQKTQLMVDT